MEKFRVSVGKNVTLSYLNRENGIYLIIKKDLSDIKSEIYPSEAPILNSFMKIPEPFEFITVDKDVIKKEIEPINTALKIAFGDIREFQIDTIQLVVGSGDDNYFTINQEDLDKYNIIPTISGVITYTDNHNETIVGIANSRFEPEKGNIIFFDALCREPQVDVASVNLKILSSVQQRGLSMQKKQSLNIIDLYLTIKTRIINEPLLDFLRQLDIDLDVVQMLRSLTLDSWIEHEAEQNESNLKGFLVKNYPELSFAEVRMIVDLRNDNNFEFQTVLKIAELLSALREERRLVSNKYEEYPFTKEEIVTAAKTALAYFRIRKEVIYPDNLDLSLLANLQKEFENL